MYPSTNHNASIAASACQVTSVKWQLNTSIGFAPIIQLDGGIRSVPSAAVKCGYRSPHSTVSLESILEFAGLKGPHYYCFAGRIDREICPSFLTRGQRA